MARITVCMPAYNRADTIARSIESVRAQHFQDWELVVVDDGSTDETRDVVGAIPDSRVRLVRQENQGLPGARTTGLAAARTELIAFLDSDDLMTPHHLALAVAFFDAHAGDHVFSSEVWDHFGSGLVVKHFRPEVGEWYPRTARRIGSPAFAEPPKDGDPYLRVYERREEVGDWGREIVARSGHSEVHHYRGDIARHWRWGWLFSVQPTVITRVARDAVGAFDARYRFGADFHWCARLCARFPVSFFSLPGTLWQEHAEGGRKIREDHLSSGRNTVRLYEEFVRIHEELFPPGDPPDPELAALIGYQHFLVATIAAEQRQREKALEHVRRALGRYPAWEARGLAWLLEAIPSDRLSGDLYRALTRSWARLSRALRLGPRG